MVIDRSRIPPNMTPGEYLIHLDEPRERPRRQPDFPPDHSRREWLLFERHWLAKIEQRPRAEGLIRMLLVAAKRRPEAREQLEGIWRVLLQSVAKNGDGEPSTEGAEGPAAAHS